MYNVETLTELFLIESDRISDEFDAEFIKIFTSDVITESVSESLLGSIRKFFVNIISSIRNFINKFIGELSHSARESSYRYQLDNLEKKINNAKKEGKTKVTMTDYITLRKEYKLMYKDLKSYAKKFIKVKYKSVVDLNNDYEKFQKTVDEWDSKLEGLSKKTVTISLDEALKFVDNEKHGYTHILDSLNDLIKTIDEMKHVAEETAKRAETLGSDIIPKHVNIFKRITTAISKTVTKFISRLIAVNVLVFA